MYKIALVWEIGAAVWVLQLLYIKFKFA